MDKTGAAGAHETRSFSVAGMTCSHCKLAVKSAVGQLNGVANVNVDLPAARVDVTYATGVIVAKTIAEAIELAGYKVK